MKKLILFLALAYSTLLSAQLGQSDNPDPVKWSASTEVNGTEVTLTLRATIEEGWHLYSQKDNGFMGPIPTSFTLKDTSLYSNDGKWTEGEPHLEYDPNFDMELEFYSHEAEFKTVVTANVPDFTLAGELEFMVCNDEMCLPPRYVDFSAQVKDAKEPWYVGLGTIFWLGFGGGLIALIMPCIFPMIPLTVSFFTKQSKSVSEGIGKAVLYGLSIIFIYVSLGMLVTVLWGADSLNQMATNPWVNLGFFALFVVFAISFFGAFEITLPSSWVNSADSASNKGGLIGIFFMAFTLSLVSFSCTGPIIGSFLVKASADGAYWGPAAAMLGFSTALAVPFTLFAIFPSWLNSMPSSGGWLNNVKVVLGFLELAFALKFLSTADMVWQAHLLEREMFIAIWTAISFLIALYLLGAFRMPLDSKPPHTSVPKLLFAIVFFVFGFYLLPGVFGAPVKIISGFPPPEHYAESKNGAYAQPLIQQVTNANGEEVSSDHKFSTHCPHNINCFDNLEDGLAYAKEVGKPVMLDFTGWGCQNCRKMEADVWSEQEILSMLRNEVVVISLYVDERTALPKDEQYVSEKTGNKIKNIGNKWSEFQEVNFGSVSQPMYIIVGHDNLKPINGSKAVSSVDEYKTWLRAGIKKFNDEHAAK